MGSRSELFYAGRGESLPTRSPPRRSWRLGQELPAKKEAWKATRSCFPPWTEWPSCILSSGLPRRAAFWSRASSAGVSVPQAADHSPPAGAPNPFSLTLTLSRDPLTTPAGPSMLLSNRPQGLGHWPTGFRVKYDRHVYNSCYAKCFMYRFQCNPHSAQRKRCC